MDETTDLMNKSQLILYTRFPDMNKEEFAEHFFQCEPVGTSPTGKAIFQKLDDSIKKVSISWEKCTSVTVDGAAAMLGKHKGVASRDEGIKWLRRQR